MVWYPRFLSYWREQGGAAFGSVPGCWFRIVTSRGYPVIGHSGSTYGFRNLLTLIPALRIGVFTSMRGKDVGYAFRGTLHSFLLDHVLGVTPWVNATTFCSFPAPWHNVSAPKTEPSYDTGRPLTHNISAYVGSYENPAYGRVEVRVRERDEVGQEGKDGGEPLAPLTVFYGFATWDLIPLPAQNGQPAEGDTSSEPELFYGKGHFAAHGSKSQ
nr:hypothetical protein BaRGS_030003 [Batillaria attramentaria]